MPKPPDIFNRLESDTSTTQPVFGVAGTVTGTMAYAAAKFGNGALTANVANYIDHAYLLDNNKGTIDFWVKANENTPVAATRTFFAADTTEKGAAANVREFITCQIASGTANLTFQIYSAINTGNVSVTYEKSFTSGDIFHVGCVWNKSGIAGGSDTMRLYVDGVDQGSSTATNQFPQDANWASYSPDTYIGVFAYSSILNPAYNYIDNIKIYDYANIEAVTNGRYNERYGCNDQIIGD